MENYLSALRSSDLAQIDLSQARLTENGVEIEPDEGLWQTITGVGDYKIEIADPVTGQIAVIGDMLEDEPSTMFAVRLKVSSNSIVEVESIIGRAAIPGTLVMKTPRASLLDVEPQDDRLSRAGMLEAAQHALPMIASARKTESK